MKLAITADIHLRNRQETKERWQALEEILSQLISHEINHLIIAGDLFDQESHNYSQFDALCKRRKFKKITLHIIPGNHDPSLKQANFTADNIHLYQQPTLVTLPNTDKQFFFIPYLKDQSMGGVLAKYKSELSHPWVLVGHGNWAETIRSPNPTEPGIYMPLSRSTLKSYKPNLTLLGHIHKPMDNRNHNVYYPGSPCGLDITETGQRTYLVLDLDNLEIKRKPIKTEVIYFDDQVVIYPMENESEYWQKLINHLRKKWNLNKQDQDKAVIRIKVTGFSSDKRKLKKFFEHKLKELTGWKDQRLDLSNLNSSDNYELLKISERVSQKIVDLNLPEKSDEPDKKQILEETMKTIYNIS
ncbi:MAG: metallophosphoesterase family protein [Patescibacteria group bacterium]|nr:metallophosphoesterase family protein [Patescibacteria group bacterium]